MSENIRGFEIRITSLPVQVLFLFCNKKRRVKDYVTKNDY